MYAPKGRALKPGSAATTHSPAGAEDNSPRRKPWDGGAEISFIPRQPQRGERNSRHRRFAFEINRGFVRGARTHGWKYTNRGYRLQQPLCLYQPTINPIFSQLHTNVCATG